MLMLGIIYSKVLLQASLKNKNSFLLKKKNAEKLNFLPKKKCSFCFTRALKHRRVSACFYLHYIIVYSQMAKTAVYKHQTPE